MKGNCKIAHWSLNNINNMVYYVCICVCLCVYILIWMGLSSEMMIAKTLEGFKFFVVVVTYFEQHLYIYHRKAHNTYNNDYKHKFTLSS